MAHVRSLYASRAIGVLIMAHVHSLYAWVIALVSFLVLDAFVCAPDGAGGPSVMESSIRAISESGTKLGRVTMMHMPVPICLSVRVCGLMGTLFC